MMTILGVGFALAESWARRGPLSSRPMLFVVNSILQSVSHVVSCYSQHINLGDLIPEKSRAYCASVGVYVLLRMTRIAPIRVAAKKMEAYCSQFPAMIPTLSPTPMPIPKSARASKPLWWLSSLYVHLAPVQGITSPSRVP